MSDQSRRHTDLIPAWRRAIWRDLHNASMWLDRHGYKIFFLLGGIGLGVVISTAEAGTPGYAVMSLISSAVRG